MIDQYTRHLLRRRRSPNTIRLRLFYLQKFANWYGRDLLTAEHDDFDGYIFANEDWSENTQQTATASIRSFYNWAHREGLVELNPARDLPAIKVHRKRPRMASEPAILHALETESDTDRAMVLLGAECGLRVSEIAALHKDSRAGTWLHIIGKGDHLRTVHLSPELAELLSLIEVTTMRWGYYFPGMKPRSHVHPSTIWRHITAVLESNPHSLRRRAGTIVYRNSGHDIRLAQEFLGHRNSATTEAYLDVADEHLELAGNLTRIGGIAA